MSLLISKHMFVYVCPLSFDASVIVSLLQRNSTENGIEQLDCLEVILIHEQYRRCRHYRHVQ